MIDSLLEQAMIALPLVCAAYITLSLLKLPDFALESAYLCGAIASYLCRDLPLPFVLLSSMLGGFAVGIMVSFMNQVLRIPYLLSAIVTNGLVHGASLLALKGGVSGFRLAEQPDELHLLAGVAAISLLGMFVLLRSQLGFSFAIYGANPYFFMNHGINSRYVVFAGIILAHTLAGMSGFLFSLTSGVVDVGMNFGVLILCITALMIGKLLKRGEVPSLLVPLAGIIGYLFVQQMLLNAGLNLKYFNTFQALVVLLIIGVNKRNSSFTLDHLGV